MADEASKESTPLELAILETLEELTPRWTSFASGTMTDAKRGAMIRLIVSGFAKTRLEYKVTNSTTGDWIKLRYTLSGNFIGDPLLRYTAAQCPPDWFNADQLQAMPGVNVVALENDWTLSITDEGDRLRKLPDNRWLLLNTVQSNNAKPVIIKDGFEHGRDSIGIQAIAEEGNGKPGPVVDMPAAAEADCFVDSDYAEPIGKSDLAFLFGVDRVTIKRRIDSGELHVLPGTLPTAKKVRIHGDDFPIGLKRKNERTQKLSELKKNGKRQ